VYCCIFEQFFDILNSRNPESMVDEIENNYLIQPFLNLYFNKLGQMQDISIVEKIFELMK